MKIGQKGINFIKGVIVIVTFSMALMYAEKILTLKSRDGYCQIQSYYKQKDNTVDALFIGSSKIHCQIDTGILWDEHGISAFDLSGAEAPVWNSYYLLREALKTQTPKVIFFDASIIAFRQDVLAQPEVWSMVNAYGLHMNENRIEMLRENSIDKKMFYRLMLPLDTMHSRYNELTKDDFDSEYNSINFKGFDFRNTTVQFDEPDVSAITEDFVFDEKHEKYLRMLINYTKEKNIPLVVMTTPYVVTPNEQGYLNYVETICEQEGVTYIDFNKMYDELNLDFKTDMAENVHLNFSGTKKLTSYLGDYIVSNYEITDHRGDPEYSSWDVDAERNRRNREIGDQEPVEMPEESEE